MGLPHDDVGSGPAIVLLHAGVADRSMWSEHLDPIADAGHRVMAFDLPGFGEASPTPEQAPWVDVLETMDALDVGRAALVGNSFGGSVALAVTALAPERVSALMLVSTLPPDLEEPSQRLGAVWDAETAALERGDVEAAVTAVVDAWTLPDAPASLRERVAGMQRRAFELQLAAEIEPVEVADPVQEDRAALATLSMPVLVAAGELDMPDCVTGATELARELPGARQAAIDGAGHLAPLEQPAAFRKLLLNFLAGSSE
jgi:pimeloyl-ACP methyl ester carboxylesterase